MKSDQIINSAYEAFSVFPRPNHFTDYQHCEECAEHDETMRSHSLNEIGSEQVGNPGWSPIPFLTDEAYGYVMPRLLELALTNGQNSDGEPFLFQYFLALSPSPEHRQFKHFTPDQASVLLESLYFIKQHMADIVERECCEEDLEAAINIWESHACT